MKKIVTLFALTATALAPVSQAQSAFQASLTPEIALVEQGSQVQGIALNIWGDNQVRGIDLGFVNQQSGNSQGFTWSILGGTVESYKGVIFGGFFTQSTGNVVGWQAAAVNLNQGSMKGLQTGFLNYSQNMTGLQLGFVNYAKQLHGVQIGLANIVEENPWFDAFPEKLAYGFPVVNWSF